MMVFFYGDLIKLYIMSFDKVESFVLGDDNTIIMMTTSDKIIPLSNSELVDILNKMMENGKDHK
jgi:hypothetical protein